MFTVFVSGFSVRHALNPHPVFGLFFDGNHPLSLPIFAERVKIVYDSNKRKGKRGKDKKPAIYVGGGEPSVRFLRSDTPQPFPTELLEFIRQEGGSFSPHSPDPMPNSIVMGFGQHAEKIYGEEYGEIGMGIGYEMQVIVPYAREVIKHLSVPSGRWIGNPCACDYALSYIAPDLLPDLYARFPQPPTEDELIRFVREAYSDTPGYAEQLLRVVLVLSTIISCNEHLERMIGAGILIFSPHRAVAFPYAFSLSPQRVTWEDLHKFVRARVTPPVASFFPVSEIEEFPELRFYYSSEFIVHSPRRSYALCRVVSLFGAIVDCVISFPSALLLQFPPCADIRLVRQVLNRAAARGSGVEAWQIQVYSEVNAFADLETRKEEIVRFLEKIVSTREGRRAATK